VVARLQMLRCCFYLLTRIPESPSTFLWLLVMENRLSLVSSDTQQSEPIAAFSLILTHSCLPSMLRDPQAQPLTPFQRPFQTDFTSLTKLDKILDTDLQLLLTGDANLLVVCFVFLNRSDFNYWNERLLALKDVQF